MVVGPMVAGGHRAPHRIGTKNPRLAYSRQRTIREPPESPAARPDDLGVRSWYNEQFGTGESPSSSVGAGMCDRSSYPSSSSSSYPYAHREMRSLTVGRPNLSLYSSIASRERESSLESNDPPGNRQVASAPRKAYMDLRDAMALLDETCPNQDVSPSLTPRTPRTPLTPFPRSRRARSKSSDNSSNYSIEAAGAERILETSKSQEKPQETKGRRPFLRKIGMSKTEDRPFLAKIIAPRIVGKPYLEKIGPSRAVEKPFLEKIGSSRTLDRFTFEALRELPRAMVRRRQPAEPSPLTIERTIRPKEGEDGLEEDDDDVVLCIIKDERDDDEENDADDDVIGGTTAGEMPLSRLERSSQRSSGKGYLLKMYSFETEDLNAATETSAAMKAHRDPLRGASLDDVLDSGPSSFPPSEDSHERPRSRSNERSTSVAELVRCRVTTSEEIFSTSLGYQGSPREATSWGNSPSGWSKRRPRRVTSAPRTRPEREQTASRMFASDESAPTSPTKRRMPADLSGSPEDPLDSSRTKSSRRPIDSLESPAKTRRQASNEEAGSSESRQDTEASKSNLSFAEEHSQPDESSLNFARCKSRRQTFKAAVEKFSASEYSGAKTRRQASEEILDRNLKNGESPRFDDGHGHFERRGLSSDNLKLSRETMVASVPSTSSLGYQSGDSSLVSQRSSHHSQDFVRGTLKLLHDKFELQELPSESYAAFKRRTKANHQHHNHQHHNLLCNDNQRTNTGDTREDSPRKEDAGNTVTNDDRTKVPGPLIPERANDSPDNPARSANEETSSESKSSVTTKSVLRKQDGVDQNSDQEAENGSSHRRPKRRMVNEPSQETMDLLTELRRVKSLLRTPSIEADKNNDFFKAPTRFPKKILITDKEFCLSVERENSVRRRPSTLGDDSTGVWKKRNEQEERKDLQARDVDPPTARTRKDDDPVQTRTNSRRQRSAAGPALFEKRCLSLDYADDEKPPKPEARAISLVAPSRTPCSATEVYEALDSSDPGGLADDARSYSSDVFTSPSDENEETRAGKTETESFEEPGAIVKTPTIVNNHCAELETAIPIDRLGSISPKKRIHAEDRTSDYYEIISPRSTPFRVKKRLGRISAAETVQQESFNINKADCRSVVTQKRTKCFPL